MSDLVATGEQPPRAEQVTSRGFKLKGREFLFGYVFASKPGLTLRWAKSAETDERFLRWEATGRPLGAIGNTAELVTIDGAFPDDPPGWWEQNALDQ